MINKTINRKISTAGAMIILSVTNLIGQSVGNGKDAHGCRASSGYTFSIIKNDCVRLFEQEIQLAEVNPEGSSTSGSAVIFSNDTRKAEVFIPGSDSGIILSRKGKEGNYVWKKGKVTLLQNDKGYILKKSQKVIFSSHSRI